MAPAERPGGFWPARISGYVVSDVRYTMAGADPTRIAAVSFTLAPRAVDRVQVRLVETSGSWYPCAGAAGRVTCDTRLPKVGLAAADTLAVVATG